MIEQLPQAIVDWFDEIFGRRAGWIAAILVSALVIGAVPFAAWLYLS